MKTTTVSVYAAFFFILVLSVSCRRDSGGLRCGVPEDRNVYGISSGYGSVSFKISSSS